MYEYVPLDDPGCSLTRILRQPFRGGLAPRREPVTGEYHHGGIGPACLDRERRALIFEDESGFYLLSGVVKTYAPEGLTPVLREKQTPDHLSVTGVMTPVGRVYTLVRQESLNGLHCIEFLLHLLRVAGDRLLMIWDGSPIHRRSEVKEFVSSTGGRVRLEALPGYAPDLNPWDEGGWHHLKNVEMRNLVCRDLDELHQELDLAVGRLRQKPHLVRSFFAQAGLTI